MTVTTSYDPPSVPPAVGGYVNALEVLRPDRLLLFISGQIPETVDGRVPADPEDQCRLIWSHINECLVAATMTTDNLVQVRTYLSSRDLAEVNTRVRQEVLGSHEPALTVIISSIFDPAWLLEIEAVAAA